MDTQLLDQTALRQNILRMRGAAQYDPDASVVIPVNAQADLDKAITLLTDLAQYHGPYRIEIVLVINNYPADEPPAALDQFRALGVEVVSVPNVRRKGEHVSLSARMHGVRAAHSQTTIHLDADCRVPYATALLDWYVAQFRAGAKAAYTPVGYYELPNTFSIRTRMMAHHLVRWFKRTVLRIPTIRGSNFAVHGATMTSFYEQGYLAVDFNIGPTFKSKGAKVAYGGGKQRTVLTSGRYIEAGWYELVRYMLYRLRYNIKMLPVRTTATQSEYYAKQNSNAQYKVFGDEGRTESVESHP